MEPGSGPPLSDFLARLTASSADLVFNLIERPVLILPSLWSEYRTLDVGQWNGPHLNRT